MLTFKKNWLWKYNRWCHDMFASKENVHYSKTICPYFWGSVWNLFGMTSVWVLVFNGVGFLASLPSELLFGLSSNLVGLFGKGFLSMSIQSLVGWFTLCLFIGIICSCVVVVQKFNKKRKPKINKKPSVIKEFIKAKKNKFCPMIKFED